MRKLRNFGLALCIGVGLVLAGTVTTTIVAPAAQSVAQTMDVPVISSAINAAVDVSYELTGVNTAYAMDEEGQEQGERWWDIVVWMLIGWLIDGGGGV